MPPVVAYEITRHFKDRLLAAFPGRILGLRIFGSMARDTAHEESDLDVFVMVDRQDELLWHGIMRIAWETSHAHDFVLELAPTVMSREHFDTLLLRERLFARDIIREGIPV